MPIPPADPSLEVFEIIEEEYAHLHPRAAPADPDRHFTAAQVRDAGAMARIFCEALAHGDHAWERSPAHSAARYDARKEHLLRCANTLLASGAP